MTLLCEQMGYSKLVYEKFQHKTAGLLQEPPLTRTDSDASALLEAKHSWDFSRLDKGSPQKVEEEVAQKRKLTTEEQFDALQSDKAKIAFGKKVRLNPHDTH